MSPDILKLNENVLFDCGFEFRFIIQLSIIIFDNAAGRLCMRKPIGYCRHFINIRRIKQGLHRAAMRVPTEDYMPDI